MTRRMHFLAATLLSCLFLPAAMAAAQPSEAPVEVTHDMAIQWTRLISPAERERAAASGWLALSRISAARDALRHRRALTARAELDQVQSALLNLREAQPIMTMRHRLAAVEQELEYTAVDQMVDDLLPLAGHVNAYATFAPVDTVKTDLEKACEHLKRGEKPAALDELRKVDEGIVAIETHLPLTRTFLAVSRALDALSRNQIDLADKSLATAERSLHVTLAEVDKADEASTARTH